MGRTAAANSAANSANNNASSGDSDFDRMEALMNKLVDTFSSMFQSCISQMDQKVLVRLDTSSAEIFDMAKKIDKAERQIDELRTENRELKSAVANLTNELSKKVEQMDVHADDVEQTMRSSNLMVYGLSGADANITGTIDVLNVKLGMTLRAADIDSMYRVNQRSMTGDSSSSVSGASAVSRKPAPLVVKFNNKKTRDDVLWNRKKLKGSSISIAEQLTARRMNLLQKANELVKTGRFSSSWSSGGRIFVKTLTGVKKSINNAADLTSL